MPKYINADQFLADESEAFIKAQIKLARSSKNITYKINEVVHQKIQMLISDAPAEEVRPVIKGKWIFHGTAWKNEYRECSVCKCYFKADMPRNSFCPNCGADMRGEEDAEIR